MPFESTVLSAGPAGFSTPLLAIAVAQGPLAPSLAEIDRAADGALSRALAADFTGKRDATVVLYPPGPASRILLIGLGPADAITAASLRRVGAIATKRARGLGVATMALFVTPEARANVAATAAGQALAEGLAQGVWSYDTLKQPPEEPKPALERADILADGEHTAMSEGHRIGAAIGAGHVFARNLQMLPGNTCTPTYLGETARELAARHGFGVTVLDKAAIVAEKMGGLLGVAQGSVEEPRFIALEYKGAEGAPVVLVGKGITFDSGGISIKPAPNMEDMKYDMSGAAAVLGTFETLGRLRPKVHVVGLIPSAENMPSGTAFKPGDVIRSHFGKTIEVQNTDAEGRLILADALSYARRYQPACVLDAATLTGAVVIALGHTAIGLMGNDDTLLDQVQQAGERAGERAWPLPMWDDYRELIKSDIADVKNTGGRPAGTITAAWFLREFVDGFPWAHLDIAGTAYSDREDPTRGKGPTGIGVRLFSEFVLARQS